MSCCRSRRLSHESVLAAFGAGAGVHVLEAFKLELCFRLAHRVFGLDSVVSVHLRVGHSDFSQASLRGPHLLPVLVLRLLVVHGTLTVVVGDNAADGSLRSVGAAESEFLAGQEHALLVDDTEGDSGVVVISELSVLLGCEGSLLHAHLVEFLEVTRVGLVDSRLLVERPFLSHYSYKKYKQSSVPLHYSSTRIARYNDTDEAGVER